MRPVFLGLVLFFLTSGVFAATAADYAAAGLQLYNAKQYTQALPYFNAALQLDPNNAQALMGAGNCYYAQGQTAQALADYQKLQALQPGNRQLTAFIQNLQTPAGYAAPEAPAANPAPASPGQAPASSPAAAAPPPSPEDQAGIALYNQKQYEASIPYFRRGIDRDPQDALAYQYLGLAQIQAGHFKEGAVALNESNYLKPDPPTASYAYQLRARLSPSDQMWVDAQLGAAGMPAGGSAATTAAKVDKPLGGYLVPAFQFIHLKALETNYTSWQSLAVESQGVDPTISYSGSVPTAALGAGLEPVLKLSKNFQVGLFFAFSPLGSASDDMHNKTKSTAQSDNFTLSSLTLGMSLKYLIFTGGFEPFLSVSPFFEPIAIDYGAQTTNGGGTQKVSGNYEGDDVGALFKLGADIHLDDTLVLTPFLGYNFSSPVAFKGNASYTGVSGQDGASQLMLEEDSQNRPFVVAQPTKDTPPPNSVPFTMDLSGFEMGLALGAFVDF